MYNCTHHIADFDCNHFVIYANEFYLFLVFYSEILNMLQ